MKRQTQYEIFRVGIRYFKKIIPALPVFFVQPTLCSNSQSIPATSPNILFIIVDDLKPVLGCYGDTIVKSPNIDQLAAHGVIFTNNHCQQAVCAPTRASLLSGMRPDFTRVWDLKTQIRDMNPDIVTMPQFFKTKGYQTAAVGKVFDIRSVDDKHDSLSWSFPYQKIERARPNGGGYVFAKERICVEAPDVPDSIMMDAEVTRQSKMLLDQMASSEKPFFLAAGYHKPHLPFVAPKKYWELYDREKIQIHPFQQFAEGTPDWVYQPGWELRTQYTDTPKEGPIPEDMQKMLIHGYYACVSFIDQQIGELIDYLRDKKLDQNTIIVLIGDHGWHLGDHAVWCKHTNLEQATRSTLIISGKNCPQGIATSIPTEFVDVFPTLCEIAGFQCPLPLQGQSLVPTMRQPTNQTKTFAVSQFQRNDSLMGYAFRDERYRYVVWLKDSFRSFMQFNPELIVARELYDYKTDPNETRNLIGNPKITKETARFERLSKKFFSDQYRYFNTKAKR